MEKNDNEIIAEFMGATLDRATSGGRRLWNIANLPEFCKQVDVPESRIRVFYAEDLEFDRSWAWLMPVVEKITGLDEDYSVRMGYGIIHNLGISSRYVYCHIENWKCDEIAGRSGTKELIEAVYMTVVDFIKWYNLNK